MKKSTPELEEEMWPPLLQSLGRAFLTLDLRFLEAKSETYGDLDLEAVVTYVRTHAVGYQKEARENPTIRTSANQMGSILLTILDQIKQEAEIKQKEGSQEEWQDVKQKALMVMNMALVTNAATKDRELALYSLFALFSALMLGFAAAKLGVEPHFPDILLGENTREQRRKWHEKKHGTREEKRARWDGYQKVVDGIRAEKPQAKWSDVCRWAAKRCNVSPKTIQRRCTDPKK